MDNRPGQPAPRLSRVLLCAACAFATLLALAGCAAPGEPTERKPPIPQPIGDLAAQQAGNAVSLSFSLPQEDVDRRALSQPLTVEIFREFQPAAALNAPASSPAPPATLLVTIPPATASNYVMQARFHYIDELRPEDLSQHPNFSAVYSVRTRVSAKKESAPSNVVSVPIYPLPVPIDDVKSEVTHSGIQLSWTAPSKTPVGAAPPISSYRIYRTQVLQTPASAQSPSAVPPMGQPMPPAAAPVSTALARIAETQSAGYLDSQIQFGNSYTYSVRSVVQMDGQELESADSNRVTILARDVFPPAAPQDLVVVYVPAQAGEAGRLELSWNISPETDLTGYNVYRSEEPGVQGTRLNSEPVPAPAFRDTTAVPSRTYYYTVTAIDRSGNESPASAAVSGSVPAEGQPAP
jgi:hypothetical protein